MFLYTNEMKREIESEESVTSMIREERKEEKKIIIISGGGKWEQKAET